MTIIVFDEDSEIVSEDRCVNCGDETHVPDDKTGLIHRSGLYACQGENESGKRIRLETVAA